MQLSSVALVFIDACKAFPSMRQLLPSVKTHAENAFVVTFLPIRVPYFLYRTMYFTMDALALAALPQPPAMGAPRPVVYSFLLATYFIAALQLYWAFVTVRAGYEKYVRGGDALTKLDLHEKGS